MEMTNSMAWLLIVVAFGLPSSLVGMLIKRIEKKMDAAEADRIERTETRVKHEIMLIDMAMASLSLAEVTAEAVQRIPDTHCNGEMTEALNKAKQVTDKYHSFEREQVVRVIQ